MTRKITLSLILILLIVGCYELIFGTQESLRKNVASVKQLETSSKELNTAVAQLERMSTTEYEQKKAQLKAAIKDYNSKKDEYEELIPDSTLEIEEVELKDIYDVDFLWTIVGNYATEEGINLKFDIIKNTTSASSLNNTSNNYIVCDLKFIITGKYINLTDFIYDIEDDDRLNFEIKNFNMQKNGEDLEVTLTVKEVKVNLNNLIDSMSSMNTTNFNTSQTQTIDSTTTSKENTANNSVFNNVN